MANIDVSSYAHSPVHEAVVTKDYSRLNKIIEGLPKLCDPANIKIESVSLAEEAKAEAIAAVIDRRDVPNRDTPLHLAVKLTDETATEILMRAGADWSLQNEQGWSALQEAICNNQEGIARIMVRHYQPWAKWCRRLPRLIATMRRMRDFYMEITFHFESSVIPFISRIAPSDTYKIWKKGANLRADMTMAGFDGFRIQRADQSILFLGDGSEDGKISSGSLLLISHKEKEIINATEAAGAPSSESEIQREVAGMLQTNMFRPGIDVTQAVLLPQMTWRRQEKEEMVGSWKARVYDMQNVVVSIKSRKVPGALTDEELLNSSYENETESDEIDDILTEEEKRQLEIALKLDSTDINNERGGGIISHQKNGYEERDIPIEDGNGYSNGGNKEKKGWFNGWRKQEKNKAENEKRNLPSRSSMSIDEKVDDLRVSPDKGPGKPAGRHSLEVVSKREENLREIEARASSSHPESGNRQKDAIRENEYKKGLRPILWLSPSFPLKTEELLPLLDILANKVKAIRRLRELLTTKLPKGSFPVKVAIPVIPTIRVLVTFTKFEELQPLDEFLTPPTSPTSSAQESTSTTQSTSSSWFQWIKTPYNSVASTSTGGPSSQLENAQDPFAIRSDYTWTTAEAKKKKMMEKNKKTKKGKNQNQK
ncbi:scaffold/adaptor protein [Lithospermum erythrorhizon]|uniref:Scaffold/adaptor protein n=1 Tax=Lithospermum erythrorhizon TaxID=34254 RepID=A0AAV3QGT1_LITER